MTGVSEKLPHIDCHSADAFIKSFQSKPPFTPAAVSSSVPVFSLGGVEGYFGAKTDFVGNLHRLPIKLHGIYWKGCVKKDTRTSLGSLE